MSKRDGVREKMSNEYDVKEVKREEYMPKQETVVSILKEIRELLKAKEDKIAEIIRLGLKPPTYGGGSWTINPSEVASAIRESLAQELEELRKKIIPLLPDLGGDWKTNYNSAITDCQAKLREGGKG